MRSLARLGIVLLLGMLVAACGDKKDGGVPSGTSTSSGGAAATAQPGGTTPGGGGLNAMSLVYIDSRNSTPQLFVSKADGTSPRKVLDLPQGSRAIVVRDGVLLAGGGQTLVLIDLRDGKTVDVRPTGMVRDARFYDSETIVFATAGGCGGENLARPTLHSYAVKDGAKKELYVHSSPGANITIAGTGKDGALAVSPRGCDIGVSEVLLLNARTGGTPVRTQTRGCGFVIASPETMDAVVSWKGCTPADGKDATVYPLLPSARPPRDLKAPAGGSNSQNWLMRPGGKEAVLGTSQTTGTGPGSTRSSGLWLVDLRSGEFQDLAPAAGAEQFPISWTPDGRYLVAAAVQAQGLCSFSIIDANEKKVTPLPEAISFCGPNGSVIGLTTIR